LAPVLPAPPIQVARSPAGGVLARGGAQTAPSVEDRLQDFLHPDSVMHFRNVEGAGFMHGQQVGGTQFDLDRLAAARRSVSPC
jgi:hypothetical protein